jgi:SPASM domain peptide maturase of grasp-with-spasm system
MNQNIFKLYAQCIPVRGANRSIICNIWHSKFRYIPNALFHILSDYENLTIAAIKKKFHNEYDTVIDTYFHFLEENDFGFYCTAQEVKLFPKLNLYFEKPYSIGNCIIDVNEKSTINYKNLYEQLNLLDCHYYQFRFFYLITPKKMDELFEHTTNVHIRSINIIMPFNNNDTLKKIIPIYIKYAITEINFHSTPSEEIDFLKKEYANYPFNFYATAINNAKYCGKINIENFNMNITSFTESQKYNSCLNKKISIDVNGEIKNCPSMQKSFGNIQYTTLADALKKKEFKKYWNINKDKIAVCKDCEFRHICTDCRAYLENPQDIHSKPLKCGYDPYTATWENWSTNPLKQQAIKFYDLIIS